MADMLRITEPVAPKSYDFTNKTQQTQNDQAFNLGDVSKIHKAQERMEEFNEQNLKDQEAQGMPKLEVAVSKNPAMSSVILRSLIGTDALEMLRASASSELLNKVTEFAGEIMLKPDQLVGDMIRQENETTIFNGKLWDALKSILSQSNGIFNNSEVKILADLNKMGILNSSQVSQGTEAHITGRITAEDIANNIKLSAQGMNADELTDAILDLMKATVNASSRENILQSISSSLRYLASEVAQSRELSQNMNAVADELNVDTFGDLKNGILSLLNYTEQSLILNDHTKNLIPLIIYNMSRFNSSDTALGESFNALINMTGNNTELSSKLNDLFVKFIENSNLPSDIKFAALKTSDSASAQRSMTLLTDRIANAVQKETEGISSHNLSNMLSGLDTSQGTTSLKNIFSPLVPDNMGGALNTLLRGFESSRDLNALIDRLGVIVNKIEDMDKKIMLAQSINEVLGELAKKENINYKPPTSMENMCDFLIKNINDPALKSLSAIDKGEMVQGLLTAPGVYTPLLHYLLPVNIDGFKAFGELWADPDAENKNGSGSQCSHMFLCFDVENTGYFELEVYANQKEINVLLLCPPGLEKVFHPLKNTIPDIAAASGFHVSNAAIGALKKRRDLTQVFPKINSRRSGLNVKI